MAFPYRDEDFEDALRDYEIFKTEKPGGFGTDDVLAYVVRNYGKAGLHELNAFVQGQIGRGIEADDFCLLTTGRYGEERRKNVLGVHVLLDSQVKVIMDFLQEVGGKFSYDALVIENKDDMPANRRNPLVLSCQQNTTDFFNPEYWIHNQAVLRQCHEFLCREGTVDSRKQIAHCLSVLNDQLPSNGAQLAATAQNPVQRRETEIAAIEQFASLVPKLSDKEWRAQIGEARDTPFLLSELGENLIDVFHQIGLAESKSLTKGLALAPQDPPIRDFMEAFEQAKTIVMQNLPGAEQPGAEPTVGKAIVIETREAPVAAKKGLFFSLGWRGRERASVEVQYKAQAQPEAPVRAPELKTAIPHIRKAGAALERIKPAMTASQTRLGAQIARATSAISLYQEIHGELARVIAVGEEMLKEWEVEAAHTITVPPTLAAPSPTDFGKVAQEPFAVTALRTRLGVLCDNAGIIGDIIKERTATNDIQMLQHMLVGQLGAKPVSELIRGYTEFATQFEILRGAQNITDAARAGELVSKDAQNISRGAIEATFNSVRAVTRNIRNGLDIIDAAPLAPQNRTKLLQAIRETSEAKPG